MNDLYIPVWNIRPAEIKRRRQVGWLGPDDPALGGFFGFPHPRSVEIDALFPGCAGRRGLPASCVPLLCWFRESGIIQFWFRSRKNRNRRVVGGPAERSKESPADRPVFGSEWNCLSRLGFLVIIPK